MSAGVQAFGGVREVALKYPGTLDLHGLCEIVRVNGPASWSDSPGELLKKTFKRTLSSGPLRGVLLGLTKLVERSAPTAFALKPLYKTLLSVHMLRGTRDGLRAYSGR